MVNITKSKLGTFLKSTITIQLAETVEEAFCMLWNSTGHCEDAFRIKLVGENSAEANFPLCLDLKINFDFDTNTVVWTELGKVVETEKLGMETVVIEHEKSGQLFSKLITIYSVNETGRKSVILYLNLDGNN